MPPTEEQVEKALEAIMCPELKKCLQQLQIMEVCGHEGTQQYASFKWCCQEIARLRQHVKILEVVSGA